MILRDAADPPNALRCIARSEGPPDRPLDIVARLDRLAIAQPEVAALVHREGRLSYAALATASRGLAARLSGESDAPVAFIGRHGPRYIAALVACLRAGRPFVPIDPDTSALRLTQILLNSGTDVVIRADGGSVDRPSLAKPLRTIPFDALDQTGPPSAIAAPPREHTAFVVFTSGSTGISKGVSQTTGSLVSTYLLAARDLDIRPGDRVALVTPPAVAPGPGFSLLAYATDARLLLASDRLDPTSLLDMLAREGATQFLCYVGLARALCGHPRAKEAFAGLRAIQTYGDIITGEDCAVLRGSLPAAARLSLLYASSECFYTAAWEPPLGIEGGRIPLGRPAPDGELWLRPLSDADEDWSQGELFVGGPRVTRGYWRDAASTRARQVIHPEDPGRTLLSMGDIVRLRPDGLLELLSRADNQVKLRGWRIELEDIETEARRLPGVRAAGVVARRNDQGVVEQLALHVAGDTTADAVTDGLRATLPDYMVPAQVIVNDDLPLTVTGKIDRVRLAEIDQQRRDAHAAVAPEPADAWPDAISRRIATLIAEEFALSSIAPDELANDLGMDSLQAVNAALRIEKQFAVSIAPELLLSERRLGSIVAEIAAQALQR